MHGCHKGDAMPRSLKAWFLGFLIFAGKVVLQGQIPNQHVYLVVVQVTGKPN